MSRFKKVNIKEGQQYSRYAKNIKPLDLIFFQGGDFVSDFIRFVEKRGLNKKSKAGYKVKADAFSHVGIVVTRDILNDTRLERGKLYIWESTMSGKLSDGINNIDGESFFGVQLRKFDDVFSAYDKNPKTRVAIAHLINSPECNKKEFGEIFKKYNGIQYDANLLSLGGSIWPCLRHLRSHVEESFDTNDWLFCSELVATVYCDLGIFDETVDPKNVVPMDFLGYDRDNAPVVVGEPVYIIK